eukprot:CFRG8547T1
MQRRAGIQTALVGYVGSGLIQPVLVDLMKYNGVIGPVMPPLLIPSILNTIGMALVYFLPGSAVRASHVKDVLFFQVRNPRLLGLCILVDMMAISLATTGLLMVGSGMFVVIYSSNTLWTALLSRILTKKVFETSHWIGIALLTLGLILNGFVSHVPRSTPANTSPTDIHSNVQVGAVVVLCATALHSLFFVLTERIISTKSLTEGQLCVGIGVVETALFSLYIAIICFFYGSHDFLVQSMATADTSVVYAMSLYMISAVVNTVHAGSFFIILGTMGAVESALVKIIQTVCVFGFSATFFCQIESTQCASPIKVGSMLLVVCGLVVYATTSAFLRKSRADARIPLAKDMP